MSLRLYADECVDARIVAGLRRRGIEVLTAGDEGLLGATDEAHLQRATDLSRVVVSNDQDFLRLANDRAMSGTGHPGLIFIRPRTRVGDAVLGVALIAHAKTPDAMCDWIEWVG
jgi:predicted nuclease of predicted toxin-antitoxin system